MEKPIHNGFLEDTEKTSTERTWQWLKAGHLKKEAEKMVCKGAGATAKLGKTPY